MPVTMLGVLYVKIFMEALQVEIPLDLELFIHPALRRSNRSTAELEAIEELAAAVDQNDGLQLHRRYRTMEAASLRLQKEAKGYLDSLRGMSMIFSL